jgi:hypothetical protein
VLGHEAFHRLAEAYLTEYPSRSFTLRNLGNRLEKFLRKEPERAGRKFDLALDVVRFEWAQVVAFDGESKPVLHVDELLGADPAKLRLGLQPYLSLLSCDFPVDDYVMAVKKHDALRNEASNAKTAAPKGARLNKVTTPKRGPVFIGVHRHENMVYYKRLVPEAFALLVALRKGATIEEACVRALRRASKKTDWAAEIRTWFENWSALGWFCEFKPDKK